VTRKKCWRSAAAETTTAADRGAAVIGQVRDAVNPLLAQAAERADEARKQVAPLADSAKEALAPATEAAKERLAPLAENAVQTVAPLAATAAVGVHKTKEQLQPHLETVAEKVQPAAEQVVHKVQDDLVPQLGDLLHQVENHPAVAEAGKRGAAAAAALRGELSLPEKKDRSLGSTVAKIAAAGTALAAIGLAVRQFLASKDDAWTPHQPSAAYRNDEPEDNPAVAEADWVDVSSDKDSSLDAAETESAPRREAASEPDPDEQMRAEGGPAGHAETTAEDLGVLNEYGEGSYVGDEPPAEYGIKGNERSMKFHTTDSEGYERTIADVWFRTVEDAERAGFTRAQS